MEADENENDHVYWWPISDDAHGMPDGALSPRGECNDGSGPSIRRVDGYDSLLL